MATLDSNSWSQHDRDALDRHITGNWGEDQYQGGADNERPEMGIGRDQWIEPLRLVYIREEGAVSIDTIRVADWVIYDAHTDERLMVCDTRHGAIDYCTDQGWDVRDGPVGGKEEVDDDDTYDLGTWPDDDPFLTP